MAMARVEQDAMAATLGIITCPICGGRFSTDVIEAHAWTCGALDDLQNEPGATVSKGLRNKQTTLAWGRPAGNSKGSTIGQVASHGLSNGRAGASTSTHFPAPPRIGPVAPLGCSAAWSVPKPGVREPAELRSGPATAMVHVPKLLNGVSVVAVDGKDEDEDKSLRQFGDDDVDDADEKEDDEAMTDRHLLAATMAFDLEDDAYDSTFMDALEALEQDDEAVSHQGIVPAASTVLGQARPGPVSSASHYQPAMARAPPPPLSVFARLKQASMIGSSSVAPERSAYTSPPRPAYDVTCVSSPDPKACVGRGLDVSCSSSACGRCGVLG